jgi:hypothetical protein
MRSAANGGRFNEPATDRAEPSVPLLFRGIRSRYATAGVARSMPGLPGSGRPASALQLAAQFAHVRGDILKYDCRARPVRGLCRTSVVSVSCGCPWLPEGEILAPGSQSCAARLPGRHESRLTAAPTAAGKQLQPQSLNFAAGDAQCLRTNSWWTGIPLIRFWMPVRIFVSRSRSSSSEMASAIG